MSGFSDRLDLLVSPRTLYSWGGALGLAKATIAHMKAGGEPRASTLRKICAVERCSSEWLSSGKGSPFDVNQTQEAGETFSAVAELLPMSNEVLVVHDGTRVAIAISVPVEEESFRYTQWNVIAGPVNAPLLDLLRAEASIRVAHTPPSDMQRLIDGQMGNWELIGDVGGSRGTRNPASVYTKAQQAPNWMAFKALTDRAFALAPLPAITQGVAEPPACYGLVDLIDRLPEDQRAAVEVIVRGLLRQH